MSNLEQRLSDHANRLQKAHLNDLFAADQRRVTRHTIKAAGLFADLSKNFIDVDTLALWNEWLEQANVSAALTAQWCGKHVNNSEDRPALHHRLRAPCDDPFIVDGQNISEEIIQARTKMRSLSEAIRQGRWCGYTGEAICDVVHIGIGGSELGPRLLCQAFAHLIDGPKIHFLATPDPRYILDLQQHLNPATTLLIIASKSFSTEETLANANAMRDWLYAHGGEAANKQMIAISANLERTAEFGIDGAHVLPFWDWVGGRFSLWSAIALPFVLQNGYEAYTELLSGAHAMDKHFRGTEANTNLPMQLALLDVWYNHYFAINNRAIITYAHALSPFPAYLQQLDMESLGKRSKANGSPLDKPSGMIIWGGNGTQTQHAFFQLIHQGQRKIPLDFITVKTAPGGMEDAQRILHSHCLAQSEALMRGRHETDLSDLPPEARYPRTSPGNRPSTTIILDDLTPEHLGALIAAYEHKITISALLYGVNAYDQWGVELGKKLTQGTQDSLCGGENQSHDPSTASLIRYLRD
ncbi:glucose-6-phosphate isomerase [Suttonella sp. R2A3]|uniref:glucose-6-phosphate isomerase n=1 Tax=Suttonella sp. R2A3 TaxID=2908648 RepID=UPI001F15A240|nr:glucose-6-phosphate isomerase [Suttonella sp. R2A3]UJF24530.1 glucose-6-phosphate isomerase [Suttonella sp. R2A3]